MVLHIESTDKIVQVQNDAQDPGVPARLWEGVTDSGIPVHVFITRIAVRNGEDHSQFERELYECRKPSPDVQRIPLRLIL